ncbi:MAG: carbon starvation protein A, partial [Bacteroidales bacterium]|nr:carbon starvation protein A [Bacteroidales bacterium]
MYSFLISIALLVAGYFLYGRFVERVFGPDPNRTTPAIAKADGIDYIAMPSWKVFMIQLLNIAGTGPIFGAILGAQFGPSCYLWIVIGCIFGGAVHDYLSGMLSVKHGGEGLPGLIGIYLGNRTKAVMLAFSVLMLMLVGAVFVYSPAKILGGMIGGGTNTAVLIWVFVVLAYYIIATLVPIDKIIGKIYPIFAIALILMAVSLFVCLLVYFPSGMPEVWGSLANRAPQNGSIFPCLFISVACGAVSGFHATQSPLMARCMKNEKLGRPIFYGAMITEGLIALLWAAVASYFFYAGGAEKMG